MEKSDVVGFLNPRDLELIILPTENCNFRCTYCYEDFEIGQMKSNVVQAIKTLIKARLPKLDNFHISWFGGEPLLAKNLVLNMNEFAKAECAAAGVSFRSSITTNAFALTPELFDSLTKLEVRRYQISIDGDEEEHNKTRKLISGRGTFARIWDNLLALRNSTEEFSILLRLHIHTENVNSLRTLLPKMHEAFGSDKRFSLFMKAVGNWGGDSVKKMNLSKNSKEVIAEFNELLTTLGWYNERIHPDTQAAQTSFTSPCYAAKPNSFVIRADGRLAKCTVAFHDDRNTVGQINDDGTLSIENEKVHSFMRGFKSLDKDELHCPMKNMAKVDAVKVIKFERKPEAIQEEAALA